MPGFYQVKPGESLGLIAQSTGVSLAELQKKNAALAKRKPAWALNVGDMLVLPSPQPASEATEQVGQPCLPCSACTVSSFEISCAHKARQFALKGPGTGEQVFQVIASSHKGDEKVTIEIAGQCPRKRAGCPGVAVFAAKDVLTMAAGLFANRFAPGLAPPKPTIATGTSPYTLALGLPYGASSSFDYFVQHVLLPEQKPEVYYVAAVPCGGSLGASLARIEVFPRVSWSGSLSIGYEHEEWDDTWKHVRKQGTWKVEGEIEVACDNRKWTLGGSADTRGANGDLLFRGAQRFLDTVSPLLSKLRSARFGAVEAHLRWPLIKLSGKVQNDEDPNGPRVLASGEVVLEAAPLLGAALTVDILGILLTMALGPLGELLNEARKRAADGYVSKAVDAKLELAIDLTMGGEIGGKLSWTRAAGAKNWKTEGQITTDLTLEIEGTASFELRVFVVKAGAGASISAETGVTGELHAATTDTGPTVGGSLTFNGLTIRYAYYYEVGGVALGTGKPKPKKELKAGDEVEDSYTIIDAVTLLGSPPGGAGA
jgi:hypothetical protein